MRRLIPLLLSIAMVLSFAPQSVAAQAAGPVYIVQAGDTLSYIASRFNVTVDELLAANPNVNPNILSEGQEIVIPGLEGISGVLETEIISFGDSLRSLSRRTQVSDEQLIKLNRLISPTELYVGISLIIPKQESQASLSTRITPTAGESLLELAVKQNSDVWTLSSLNKLSGTWAAISGDVLYSPTGNNEAGATGLPSAFQAVSIEPLPLVQGGTEVIRVQAQDAPTLSGTLVDKPLHFFPNEGQEIALQGVHALLEPGGYPLLVEATLPDGTKQSFEQMVLVVSGDYYSEELYVPAETIDPAVTELENQSILSVIAPANPTKFWNGGFKSPSVYPDQYTSRYGTRRLYHGTGTDLEIEGFHTGLDFAGGEGLQIYAPAAGKVVFAAPLTVRGNATIIDHGWGVYSGFWHQSQILVNVGDTVEPGQVIGLVGGTGRVTGAHLHWEVWANGVQVNPLDWLNQIYP